MQWNRRPLGGIVAAATAASSYLASLEQRGLSGWEGRHG